MFWGVVGIDPVELECTAPLSTASLISGCRIRRRTSFAGGVAGPPSDVLCYGVLWRPRGQVVASLGQWALFEVFPRLWLLEMAGACGVFREYVYTSSAIPAFHAV